MNLIERILSSSSIFQVTDACSDVATAASPNGLFNGCLVGRRSLLLPRRCTMHNVRCGAVGRRCCVRSRKSTSIKDLIVPSLQDHAIAIRLL